MELVGYRGGRLGFIALVGFVLCETDVIRNKNLRETE